MVGAEETGRRQSGTRKLSVSKKRLRQRLSDDEKSSSPELRKRPRPSYRPKVPSSSSSASFNEEDYHSDDDQTSTSSLSEESWCPPKSEGSEGSLSRCHSAGPSPPRKSRKPGGCRDSVGSVLSAQFHHSDDSYHPAFPRRSMTVISISSSSEAGGGDDIEIGKHHHANSPQDEDDDAICQTHDDVDDDDDSNDTTYNNQHFNDHSLFNYEIHYQNFSAKNRPSTRSTFSSTSRSSTSNRSTPGHDRSPGDAHDDRLRLQTPHTPSVPPPMIVDHETSGYDPRSSDTPQSEEAFERKQQGLVVEKSHETSCGDVGSQVDELERSIEKFGEDEMDVDTIGKEDEAHMNERFQVEQGVMSEMKKDHAMAGVGTCKIGQPSSHSSPAKGDSSMMDMRASAEITPTSASSTSSLFLTPQTSTSTTIPSHLQSALALIALLLKLKPRSCSSDFWIALLSIWSDAVRSATTTKQLLSIMGTIEESPVFAEKDRHADIGTERQTALETIEWIKKME